LFCAGATGGCAAAAARLVRELEAPEMASPRASSEERSVASLEHISADEFAEQLTVLTHKAKKIMRGV
jgi:hypothetical protein